MMENGRPTRVYGVDFSGAANAGTKIWVSSGMVMAGVLHVEDCIRGDRLPNAGVGRSEALNALVEFMAQAGESTFGLDFPFGVPRSLVQAQDWPSFVLAFPDRYPGPDDFYHSCHAANGGREMKRRVDTEARAPFAAYNVRMYRQTYHGIRDVLVPLVSRDAARVLPMQSPMPGRPSVVEVCPASTLKAESLYVSYKHRGEEYRRARLHILSELERRGPLQLTDPRLREAILDDHQGDALDSVVAAYAVFKSQPQFGKARAEYSEDCLLEGYIYSGT
ncbi:MAG: DUF429 domain-containing protein [Anaerolineae bacterium]